MTTALQPSLFRFVQVRRLGPPPPPPPPPDLPQSVFDFTDALLPAVLDVIRNRDRDTGAELAASLLGQLSPASTKVMTTLRRMLSRVATNELTTLGDLRAAPDGDVAGTPAFADVVRRATSTVVLERWLGLARSPNASRAFRLLRGAVVARLLALPLEDAHRVVDLVKGHSIVLPDPRPDIVAAPAEVPIGGLPQLRRDLLRVGARASAAGLGDDPPLVAVQGGVLGDLNLVVNRAATAARRMGIPTTAPLSALVRSIDAELIQVGEIDPGTEVEGGGGVQVPMSPPSLPVLDARARVLGRGDLMVVRIEHLRYETGEIAYVENVLKSELRGRTHVIDTATSEKIVETADLFSETSQELTTTERFELQDAATTANTTTTALSAGVSMSGGFGPVSVGIDLNASTSTTTSESNSSSSSYGKEVTDKATETMRSEASSKTVTTNRTRITETNKHDFDNRDGDGHIRGIYRWLNKVDRAQVFNYGERLLLEFVVPEPAAQHVYLAATTASQGEPVPPQPLDFGPEDITEATFVAKGRRYDTAGLERPPAAQVTVPATFTFAPSMAADPVNPDPEQPAQPVFLANSVTISTVAVPAGYAAGTVIASVVYGGSLATGDIPPPDSGVPENILKQAPVMITVGGRRFSIVAGDAEESHVIELTERRTGDVPVAIGCQQANGIAVALRVVGYRTPEAFQAWQQRTFETIQQAYLAEESAYETALSVTQIRAGFTAVTPSVVNRAIEVRELTRGCQTILTGQDFDDFGSIDVPANDIPRIDVEEAWAEADVIQFFSDTLDWQLMAYLFYPYHWAGRTRWAELVARTSPDPLHEAFLQAGAARVVVPVREGYERAVARYLQDGVVPEWGPEPWRGQPTGFVPVDDLIADANDRPGDEVAIDEPWEVVSPTTLIYLQEDAELNPPSTPAPQAVA